MHDELLYDQATVHTIRLRLENGSADVTASAEGEDVRILIDTDAEDAAAFLSADMKDGTLLIRQKTPFRQLLKDRRRPSLHVTVEAPHAWKGALDARSGSGDIRIEGLSGTDVTVRTGSGTAQARQINGICVTLGSRRGSVAAEDIDCEKLRLATVTADADARACGFEQGRALSLTGHTRMGITERMGRFRCRTITGALTVETVYPAVDAVLHAAKSRLRTQGVDLADDQPMIRMTTLTGRLMITRPEGE